MFVKIHKATRLVVAVCDSNLLGKRFEERNLQLDLTGGFFRGEEKSDKEVGELFEFYRMEDACFNIVGEESCQIAKQKGLVSEEGISRIDKVPFALVLV
jgi:hypothetical protein